MKEMHQFKITIAGSKPPIWRRVLVPASFTLIKLHDVIQACFGWEDCHLFSFELFGKVYDDENPGTLTKKLNKLSLGSQQAFTYTYDFGDNWEHEILLEKIIPDDASQKGPCCVAGKRAAPPEDCGGMWGYADKVAVLADPEHPEYEETLKWMGEDFTPDAFNMANVNARLADLGR